MTTNPDMHAISCVNSAAELKITMAPSWRLFARRGRESGEYGQSFILCGRPQQAFKRTSKLSVCVVVT